MKCAICQKEIDLFLWLIQEEVTPLLQSIAVARTVCPEHISTHPVDVILPENGVDKIELL